MKTAEIVTVRALRRRFEERDVIADLSLAVAAGERVALHGPNGAGKTTLLRCIAGTIAPTSGAIRILGAPAGSMAARKQTGISLSLDRSFYLRLTGRENLVLFARLRGQTRRQARSIIDGLNEELMLDRVLVTRTDRCSTGMLQKLGLARALLASPPLLLLDEPTRSLDEAARSLVWGALDRRPDAAVLVATHERGDLAHCGRIIDLPA